MDSAFSPVGGFIDTKGDGVIDPQEWKVVTAFRDAEPRRPADDPEGEASGGERKIMKPGGNSPRQRSSRPAAKSSQRTGANRAPSNTLSGLWRGWVVDGRGENPNGGHMELELRIEGNRIAARELGTNRAKDGLGAGTFTISGSATSGEIDAVGTSGPQTGKRFLGIFELQGDTLKWCSADKNRPRPSEYGTGRGNYLMILRRS